MLPGPRRFFNPDAAMVKLHGPALSLSAAGSIGDGITISNWKGRPYLKRKSTPADPRSEAQVLQRLMMGFLSQAWPNLTDAQRATWTNVARPQKVPPYNAFLGYNLARINLEKGPSKRYPAAEQGTLPTIGKYEPSVTGGVHCIDTDLLYTPAEDTWGYLLIARPESGSPPDLTDIAYINIGHVSPVHNLATLQLAPGVWRISARLFTDDGIIGPTRNPQSTTSYDY